jgi:uncharacterized protein YkwD
MCIDRRILAGAALLGGLLLLALPEPATAARQSLLQALNEVRERGCEGKRGVSSSLRTSRRLDDAARRLMRGDKLKEALERAEYRALHSYSFQLTSAGSDADAVRVFAGRSCDELLDAEIRELGIARRGKDLWIILAAPLAAPALENAQAVRQRVLQLANEARARPRRCGSKSFTAAKPLRLSARLDAAALAHSRDMARHSRMSHQGTDGSTPAVRATRAEYAWRVVGENVAAGPTTPDEVMQGWLASPHHCENLMDPRFTELGVGFVFDPKSRSGVYWTQVFALPKEP